jgi:hypothetical protein
MASEGKMRANKEANFWHNLGEAGADAIDRRRSGSHAEMAAPTTHMQPVQPVR